MMLIRPNSETHVVKSDLAEHEISFRELHEHILRSKSIVELQLEIFNLNFSVRQLDNRFVV